MRSVGVAACLLMLLACGACTAAAHGGRRPSLRAAVVTYTPRAGQAIPADLVEASPFLLGVSVRSVFACFTSDGTPVDWPAGYSAVREASGALRVREKTGRLLRTGGTQLLEQITVTSAGDACSRKGQNVIAVLSLPKSL